MSNWLLSHQLCEERLLSVILHQLNLDIQAISGLKAGVTVDKAPGTSHSQETRQWHHNGIATYMHVYSVLDL